MAGFVHAVYMCISWFAALMAFSYDLFRDAFPQPVVEHKVLSMKFSLQAFGSYLVGIINNATLEMKHIFKSFV